MQDQSLSCAKPETPRQTMNFDPDTLRLIERLHVRAWPATQSAHVDGWLWRWSGGGSQRANAVSTIDFTGTDPEAVLDRVEALYRAKGAPVRLHTYDLTRPKSLPALLAARSYGRGETTVTMLATTQTGPPPPGVHAANEPSAAWLSVYMEAISDNRRAVNREILRRIPGPRMFFTVYHDGRAISTALGVVHGGHAVAECVATRADARGQRGADSAMRALMAWAASLGAQTVGLQVVDTNVSASRLYTRLGFAAAATNRFWIGP